MGSANDPLPRVHRKRGVNMQNNKAVHASERKRSEIITQITQMLDSMSDRDLYVLIGFIRHISSDRKSN